MEKTPRYPVCSCHPNDLKSAPDTAILVEYASCARHCAFCPAVYRSAPSLRKHECTRDNVEIKPGKSGNQRRKEKAHHFWPRKNVVLEHRAERSLAQTQVIWTAVEPWGKKISSMRTLNVSFLQTAEDLEKTVPWFNRDTLEITSRELGHQLIQHGHTQPDIHQGVVIMMILQHMTDCKLQMKSWKRFCKEILGKTETEVMDAVFRDTEGRPLRTVILPQWTDDISWTQKAMDEFYTRLQHYRIRHNALIHCIPSYTEALQDRVKRDISALDAIACRRNQYRPQTCYPGGKCSLQTEKTTVHKRQDSCGKEHVQVKRQLDRGELSCWTTSDKRTRLNTNGPLWFHQEYIDTFVEIGEFLAFIVTKPDPTAIRGRRGVVASIAHTRLHEDRLYVERVKDGVFERFSNGHVTRKDFDEFCLATFEDLLGTPDWKESFESLQIAVRLDVAFSPNCKELFVNEVTRFYSMDMFSEDIEAEPKYTLCEKVADSLASYLSTLP